MFVMVLTLKCWTWLDISTRSNVRVLDNDIDLETIYYVKMIKSPSFMVRSLSTTLKWKWKENICYQENICVAGCGADVGQWSILTNVLDVKHCRVSRNSNNNRNNSTVMIWRWPLSPGRITTRQTPTKHQHAIYACCMCCAIIIIVVCAMWISCSLLTKRIII